MQNTKWIRNIILAFVFFAIGRMIVLRMGRGGIWIIFGLVAVFYFSWWFFYRKR